MLLYNFFDRSNDFKTGFNFIFFHILIQPFYLNSIVYLIKSYNFKGKHEDFYSSLAF